VILAEALKFLASQSLSHMVTRDHDGWTPAHIASYYARTEVPPIENGTAIQKCLPCLGRPLTAGRFAQVLILMVKVSPSVLGIRTNDGRTPRDLASTPVCKQVLTINVEIRSLMPHVVTRSTTIEAPTKMKISSSYLTALCVPPCTAAGSLSRETGGRF